MAKEKHRLSKKESNKMAIEMIVGDADHLVVKRDLDMNEINEEDIFPYRSVKIGSYDRVKR